MFDQAGSNMAADRSARNHDRIALWHC